PPPSPRVPRLTEALHPRLPDAEPTTPAGPSRRAEVLTLVPRGSPASRPRRPSPGTACVDRIRAGDRRAFDVLFESYYPALCDFVSARIGSPEVAEELVQDVFIDLWQRRARLDPHAALRAFLYRAAKNQALNYLRRRRVEDRAR